jgi:hypothetical protein
MARTIKVTASVIGLTALLGLSGCAESIYPQLPSLLGSGSDTKSTLLTPTERDKTIQDMTAAQKSHSTAAANEIARRE